MSELLVVRGLKKSFHDGERELRVLRGVDLSVRAGQAIAVVGMSGDNTPETPAMLVNREAESTSVTSSSLAATEMPWNDGPPVAP